MKRRLAPSNDKLQLDMTPMIDCTFQLIIFFMLQLKIIQPEGDFNINMPPPGQGPQALGAVIPDIKVTLKSNPDGSLAALMLGQRNLGNSPKVYGLLNEEILQIIGRPGDPATKDTEVEIDIDYKLHFKHVVATVSACSGKLDKKGRLVRYIEKIKFTPPRKPRE